MVKLWYIHIMKYYSAVKRNKLLIHATTWMDLKGIMLNDKKPTLKGHILCYCIYITVSEWKNFRDEEEISDCQALEVVVVWGE